MSALPTRDDPFERLRPRLFGIAYRMLGIRADAEDVVQDAWLRWRSADAGSLQSAEAWLVTVTTRIAIDRLRAAKAEREVYVGEWLPEPLVEWDADTPESIVERAGELSIAFLHMLERLGADERAAFLLRQAFDYDYGEIARMLGKTEANVRQMIHRAGERLRLDRPRFEVPREEHRRLLESFVRAAGTGDRAAIRALLADDAEAIGDGGGKVAAVAGGFHGADRVTNLYWAQSLRWRERVEYRLATINGEPGFLRYVDGLLESAQAVATDGKKNKTNNNKNNPNKHTRIESGG